jgi:inhibitor of cysteine peptidase
MSDKYINFDIDDPRASAIAEAMSNKTSKKILSLLADKEMSGSDIAEALGLPLNTVGYNIEKLLKAGLIEKSKTFFWSSKGKKIPTYKVSNKKILISPKKMISTPVMAAFGVIAALIILAILMISLQNGDGPVTVNQPGNEVVDFKNFNSQVELDKYLKDNTVDPGYGYGMFDGLLNTVTKSIGVAAPTASIAESVADSSGGRGGSADSYSQTNVQVEGVDEPDIVKNDGRYIYTVSGGKVVIVDAYPAKDMKNLSTIDVNNVQNIFVNGDKLIVFSNGYMAYVIDGPTTDSTQKIAGDMMPCRYGYGCGGGASMTNILVYDISDRSDPEIEKNFSIEGNYNDARMIGKYVYLVSSKYVYSERPMPPIYIMDGVKTDIAASDVMYYPGYEDTSFTFTTVSALNIDNNEVSKKVFLTGSTSTIYASEKNIYLTYQKRMSYRDYNERLLEEAVIPTLPADLMNQADNIMDSNKDINEKYRDVMELVVNHSNSLTDEERSNFDERLQNSTNKFADEMAKEYEKTVIMKIAVDGSGIDMKSTGEVPGHLLNQFSMDEFEDTFRVTTTTGDVWNGNSLNHLFVLDSSMDIIGSVQGLAPGERIYSTRFMGERAYIVTFKKIDPFYVIDLSNPSSPKVLGYLKIPGYSDYLHPYDEDHIIGIGKNALGGGENFAWYQGIKISLFDVSDFENPKEVAHLDIGDRGTDSSALYDHKAFLFDKEKNMMVVPITLAEIDESKYRNCSESELGRYDSYSYCLTDSTYGETIWQGAYVIYIDSNTLEVRGKITHIEDQTREISAREEPIGAKRTDSMGNVWEKIAVNAWKTDAKGYEYETYYDYQIDNFPNGYNEYRNKMYDYSSQVQRSLYMDDVLYTISQKMIKANDIESLSEISNVNLGYKENNYWYAEPLIAR